MTVIINPSTSAIKAISGIVAAANPQEPAAQDFVQAVLAQMSLEDFELQDQQAWVKILNSLLQISRQRIPGVASVRVNQEVSLQADNSHTRSSLEIVSDDFPFLVD
jgi:NAD-specific glutamate dehydrogenase